MASPKRISFSHSSSLPSFHSIYTNSVPIAYQQQQSSIDHDDDDAHFILQVFNTIVITLIEPTSLPSSPESSILLPTPSLNRVLLSSHLLLFSSLPPSLTEPTIPPDKLSTLPHVRSGVPPILNPHQRHQLTCTNSSILPANLIQFRPPHTLSLTIFSVFTCLSSSLFYHFCYPVYLIR